MAEEEKTEDGGGPGKPAWQELVEAGAKQVAGVLLTAGGLIGFVAFAGAVIVWTRFSAANVPADQAVNAVPTEELVAIGSSLLLVFGFFGVLAVIAVYLIDRGGRVTPGMGRGLLLLLAIEGVAAILLVKDVQWQRTAIAIELLLLAMAVMLWSTFSGRFTQLDKTSLAERSDDERDAVLENHAFRTDKNGDPVNGWLYLIVAGVALNGGILAGLLARVIFGSTLDGLAVGIIASGLVLLAAVLLQEDAFRRSEARKPARKEDTASGSVQSFLLAVERQGEEDLRKPPAFKLKGSGVVLFSFMFLLAAAGPSLALERLWLVASLGSAIVLAAGLWRIGYLAASKFIWYGFAVFISVPLFGTLTTMARNIEDPQVQPMALIRNTDGPDEAIQGIYVTEADQRIYFATVETEGCTNELSPHSGRLLWVPRSEVVAMTVGPAQDVEDAAHTALEMSYALTPGLGLPSRAGTGLAVEDGQGDVTTKLDKRLEGVGSAVHPNFGSGLSLVPPDASPGQVVTLRVSQPNHENGLEGFGSLRGEKVLRVGGVPATIIREKAVKAWQAEFVKTKKNKAGESEVLALAKKQVFGRDEKGRFVRQEDPSKYDGERFVKLTGSSGAKVEGYFHAHGGGSYLALQSRDEEREAGVPALLKGQRVILKSGEEVGLESYLLQQGWHEDQIKFRVPADASSGVVSVECNQLAGQPVLNVARPPTARIAVHMRAGSEHVSFDSVRSRAEDAIVSRRWTVGGRARRGGTRVSLDLPPRLKPYTVRLTVTDENHRSDSAQLRLARMPASLFGFDSEKPENKGAIKRIGRSLAWAVRAESPIAIELDGHTDKVGSPAYNLRLSLHRVKVVRRQLLANSPASGATAAASSVPMALRAFGETCPLDRTHGRSQIDRRVEVFVLGQGTTVASRPGCHVGREEDTAWRPQP